MKVNNLKQKSQQVVELGGDKSMAAFALSLAFNIWHVT